MSKVYIIRISYNMGTSALPDMNAPGPPAYIDSYN